MGAGSMRRRDCGYTPTLDALVVAICADYARRETAIREEAVSLRTRMEYKYLNYRILEAAAEIVGERYAMLYIEEIGSKTGYARSKHDAVGEGLYKEEKREVKINIARKLHLID